MGGLEIGVAVGEKCMVVECNTGWHYMGICASHQLSAVVGKDFPRAGTDQSSLKLKVVAYTGDPKLYVGALGSYLRVEDLKFCASKGFWVVWINQKIIYLATWSKFDSHRPYKVNYFIPRPNTSSKRTCVLEVTFKHDDNVVSHITNVL